MSKIYFSVLFVLLITAQGFAQQNRSYKFFHPNNNHKDVGYYGAALTSVSRSISDPIKQVVQVSPTTPYDMSLTARGAVGIGAEAGLFYVTKHGPFGFLDFGAGYRQVKGFELMNAQRAPGSDLSFPDYLKSEGQFTAHHAKAHVNAQFVKLSGRSAFFHGGPGMYFDHIVFAKAEYASTILKIENDLPMTRADAGFSCTAGYAFQVGPAKYIDIYAHLPIYSLNRANGLKYEAFSSTYRNYILGIRYMWLSAKANRVCPAFSGGSQGARFSKRLKPNPNRRPW